MTVGPEPEVVFLGLPGLPRDAAASESGRELLGSSLFIGVVEAGQQLRHAVPLIVTATGSF